MYKGGGARTKIGLVGYYGYGNYGDELFKVIFEQRFREIDLVVLDVPRLSTDPDYLEWFEREIGGVILGGGDLIIPSSWAPWYFSPHLLIKPVFIYGVGVPTWAGVNESVVAQLQAYLSHPNIRLIVARDVESQAWMQENLRLPTPVQHFADMVCAMRLSAVAKPPGAPIFTLISRHQPPGEIGWANIAALCERARSLGYRIRHLVLATGSTRVNDLETLATDLPGIEWELEQSDSLERLTELLGESTMVASMKFHGCVVAALYGAPAIILATTDKFENFLRQIERPDLHCHHTFATLPDHLPRYVAPIPSHTVAHLRRNAEEGLQALEASLFDILAKPHRLAP
jgi:polysaccharide pyruvyl transferase WcaK-like protein